MDGVREEEAYLVFDQDAHDEGGLDGEDEREEGRELKREEKIIKAQKRRIDQKSLVMSEFSTGFVGIAKQDKEARKAKKLKTKR